MSEFRVKATPILAKYGVIWKENQPLSRVMMQLALPKMSKEETYIFAIFFADVSIQGKGVPFTWDELPDTNSMWDYIGDNMNYENFRDAVRNAAGDRLNDYCI